MAMQVPLTRLIPDAILSEPVRFLLDALVITDFTVTVNDGFTDASLAIGPSAGDPRIEIGGPDGFALVFRQLATLDIYLAGTLEIRMGLSEITVELPSVLRPARLENDRWVPIPNQRQTVTLRSSQGSFGIRWHSEAGFGFVWPVDAAGVPDAPVFSLTETLLGETRIVISADTIGIRPDPDDFALTINEAAVILPEEFLSAPDLRFNNCRIDSRGFTGTASAEWNDLTFDEGTRSLTGSIVGNLFGCTGGLDRLTIEFLESLPIAVDIAGALLVPYFEKPAFVRVNLEPGGVYSVTLNPGGGEVTLTKEELLELRLASLTIARDTEGQTSLVLSGGLTPLLMASDGLKWPRLDVKDLYIDTTGKFRISEAWLDLKDLATLDLWGFHFELRRIGLGYEDIPRDRLWIDLSGGVRLIEQIPVGVDVEGFRLTWPRTLFDGLPTPLTLDDIQQMASQVEVQFDGIYLFFGVPDAVEFEGLIRFFKDAQIVGFAGDMALRVPASGFGAEAGLLIGMNFETPPYPFLYVYFGVDLPAGIPLGQSGLALKGAQGMFGLNVTPDKAPEENWYYDWYKRGPIVGAHPTNKWKPGRDALALGVGVTITTADGYVKGTRGLLVLSIPGPILIIEGRALILNGLQPNAEPPLRALAVFDGIAGTAQFNVEAEATLIEDMLEAYGMLEAFFDFNDLTNWHLYLGQDEPRDRRIRANVLKFNDAFLFNADAYLMIDMVGADTLRSRMGVFIGFDPPIPDVGPVKIDFNATLEGDGVVTVRPEQFSGDIGMSANIGLSAFGFSVKLSADAGVLTEGALPFRVGANVHVAAEMPAPLDPVETNLEFAWQWDGQPEVESPLSEITVNSRFAPSGEGFRSDANEEKYLIHDASSASSLDSLRSEWESLAKQSPIVPVDSQPIIAFKHEMNSEFFARHPDGDPKYYELGMIRFTPTLTTVKLYEHRKKQNDTWHGDDSDWILIASSDANDNKPLPGVWLSESDPQSPDAPSARRVQLWTDNPLIHAGRALGAGHLQFLGSIKEGKSLPGRVLTDYPDLMKCQFTEAKRICVDFRGADGIVIEPGEEWEREGLRFGGTFEQPAKVQSVTDTVGMSPTRLQDTRELAKRNLLAALSETISAAIAEGLRRFFPALGRLWDRLFDRRITRTCLFVDGYLDIRFPRNVRKVWITFCQSPKLSPSHVRPRTRVRRTARTFTELAQSRDGALRNGSTLDLRACAYNIPFNLTVSGNEWLIESDEGLNCVEFLRMGEFAISEICYLTDNEIERAERAERQCQTNRSQPTEGQTLRPGAYYRLDVTTSVLGQLNVEELPFATDPFLGPMFVTAYEGIMSALGFGDNGPPKSFQQVIFFQTEDPPENLRPYVKWSSPSHQAGRVFYEDDIAIRFLRSNVAAMFSDPYDLEIQIRDTQDKLVEGYDTEWLKSGSATLFAEEQVWQEHRSDLDWPPAPAKNDDILIAKRDWESVTKKLLPKARYEVRVVRNDNLVNPEDKALFSTPFITSTFPSFGALVSSYNGSAVSIAAKDEYQASLSMIPDLVASAGAFARAEWEWHRDLINYRFEMLSGGREGLEQARLRLRQTRATHDANFRALAESLADLYFQPFSERLQVYVLKDANTARAVCVWLLSPESVDLQMSVLEHPDDEVSNRIDYIGRTEVRLRHQGSTVPSPKSMLHNADSTQVLLFPPSNTAWVTGVHNLVFTYHRDYGDEAKEIDHRYDRPIEFRRGSSESEETTIEFVL